MKNRYLMPLFVALLIMTGNIYAESHQADADIIKADINQDGKVSFAEFEAAHHAEMLKRFEMKDLNQDGFIDLEENVIAKEKVQAKQQLEHKTEKKVLREKYQEDRKRRKRHFFKYH